VLKVDKWRKLKLLSVIKNNFVSLDLKDQTIKKVKRNVFSILKENKKYELKTKFTQFKRKI